MLEGTDYYTVRDDDDDDPVLVHHPSGSDVDTWREGYPYDHRMSRSEYEEQKRLLQIELLKLQEMSLKEAAAVSGMTVAALKVATHRALKTLRKVLGRQDRRT